jgi:ubiquinone/menaquinone biosynthesis C-methylase UbiE
MTNPQQENNIYFIDPESGAEMARLTNQDHIVTKYMGGLFSEIDDLSTLHRVLDVACGPGGWAQEVAFTYPKMKVVGFDISNAMVKYARAQASVQGLDNATFHMMDLQKQWDFPDQSFDFVNSRFITFLPAHVWHHMAQEIGRVTRPGGYVRLTETEWWCLSTSPALEELNNIITRSIKLQGGFSTTGRFTGVLPMLGQLLQESGCSDINYKTYSIDYSYGTEPYESFRRDAEVIFKLSQPQMVALGLATQAELDKLYDEMLIQMRRETFRSLMLIVSAYGQKAQPGD